MNSNLTWRFMKDRIFRYLVYLFAGLTIVPLFLIFYYIFKEGIQAINWQFLTGLPKPVGEAGGGVFNAILGTLYLIGLAMLIALPIGVAGGIYLTESPKGKMPSTVRLAVEILHSIPSIVIGIIAYLWVVKPLRSFSMLSGAVALAIMMLPVIVRTTEETIKLIPKTFREASLALGVPYYRTVLKVVLPAGFSGIATGVLLSVARVAGETAPLLFTAFGSPFLSQHLLKPVNALPLVIFNYATSPYDEWLAQAWGASLLLLLLVFIFNILAKIVGAKWKVNY